MTISTTQNQSTVFGNGATTVWSFPFVPDSASDITVIYTNASGAQTTLLPSQYTITIAPVAPGQLWPTSFTLTYPISGSPIASGTSLTVQRILPLTQATSISNQGNFDPTIVEQAIDTTVMQIQQVSSRTGQQRGTWATGVVYNFGDVVQDGANGLNSLSYYMCAVANTSGVWTTDLTNGYWSLVIQSTIPVAALPLSISNGGTGQSSAATALNALGGISLGGNNVYTGSNNFVSATISVPTVSASDSSTKAASTAFVNGTALTLAAGTTAVTQSANDSSTKVATTAFVNPANSLGTSGYQKFSSGLIVQWGVTGLTSGGSITISWPVAFPTNIFSATGDVYNSTNNAGTLVQVGVPSTSGVTFYATNSTTGGAQGPTTISWSAFGN